MMSYPGLPFKKLGLTGLAAPKEIRRRAEMLRVQASLEEVAVASRRQEEIHTATSVLESIESRLRAGLYWFWQPTGHWLHDIDIASAQALQDARHQLSSEPNPTGDAAHAGAIRIHDLAVLALLQAIRSDSSGADRRAALKHWADLAQAPTMWSVYEAATALGSEDPRIQERIAECRRAIGDDLLMLLEQRLMPDNFAGYVDLIDELRAAGFDAAAESCRQRVNARIDSNLKNEIHRADVVIFDKSKNPPFDESVRTLFRVLLPALDRAVDIERQSGGILAASDRVIDDGVESINHIGARLNEKRQYLPAFRAVALALRYTRSESLRARLDENKRIVLGGYHEAAMVAAVNAGDNVSLAVHLTLSLSQLTEPDKIKATRDFYHTVNGQLDSRGRKRVSEQVTSLTGALERDFVAEATFMSPDPVAPPAGATRNATVTSAGRISDRTGDRLVVGDRPEPTTSGPAPRTAQPTVSPTPGSVTGNVEATPAHESPRGKKWQRRVAWVLIIALAACVACAIIGALVDEEPSTSRGGSVRPEVAGSLGISACLVERHGREREGREGAFWQVDAGDWG